MRKLVLVFGLLMISACAAKQVPLDNHNDWAKYCLRQSSQDFEECLQQWNEWEKHNNERQNPS